MKIRASAANRRSYSAAHRIADASYLGLEGNDDGGITVSFTTLKLSLSGRFNMAIEFSAEELRSLAKAAANHRLKLEIDDLTHQLDEARDEIETLRGNPRA